jgi:hypothetical protein
MSVYKKVNGVLVKTTDSELPLTQTQLEATNSGITSAKVSKLDALPTSTQLENSIDTSWHASDHLYEGRDLTVVFASEIANYSDEWAWIQTRLNTHNLRGIHVADYIPINVTAGGGAPAQVHKAEVAGINTYRRTGNGVNEVGYHIDWITRDCYSVPVKWDTENNNNGNSSNAQPFLASNLKNWLDTVVYPGLRRNSRTLLSRRECLLRLVIRAEQPSRMITHGYGHPLTNYGFHLNRRYSTPLRGRRRDLDMGRLFSIRYSPIVMSIE